MRSKRQLGLLILVSLLLTLFLVHGTGYASLSDVVGQTNSAKNTFLSSLPFAAQSVSDSSSSSPAPTPGFPTSYNSEAIKVFRLSSGFWEVYTFEPGTTNGLLLGRFRPTDFDTTRSKDFAFDAVRGWQMIVYFLGTDASGRKVFQINVYNPSGQLVDDRFRFTN